MRVALIDKNPPNAIGGSERTNFFLGRVLEEAGHSVTFIHRDTVGTQQGKYIELPDVLRTAARIGAEIERRKTEFDLVIVSGMMSWRVRFQPAIQIYNATHYGMRFHRGLLDPRAHVAWKICCEMERLGGRNKWIVAVSTPTGWEAENKYKLPVSRIIQNGIDMEHFRPQADKAALRRRFDLPQDRFLAAFVGRLSPQKGLNVLTEAARLLPEHISIVAAIPDPVGFDDKIIERIRVPYADMPALYSACDCLLLPSRNEGCSLSVIEAMACNLPLVISRVGHAVDICEEDEVIARGVVTGWRASDYVDRLKMFADDPDLCRECGARCRAYTERHNTLEVFGRAYLDLIAEIMRTQ